MLNKRLLILFSGLIISMVLFLFLKPRGDWGFLLSFRGEKIWGMTLVALAIGVSTIVFQTLTANRILTPAIIGLDALFILAQTSMIFFGGSAFYLSFSKSELFYLNTGLMMTLAGVLFYFLMPLFIRDIYRLLLVGVIFGVLCRKADELMGRMLDPTEYDFVVTFTYAQFNTIKSDLLHHATFIILAGVIYIWRKKALLDIMALGRVQAIGLGVHYYRELMVFMLIVSLLIAVSTALVGPILFFGLLVSALTYRLFPTPYHHYLLPASALLAGIILILGQTIFERFFNFAATLSVVIESVGGLVFIYLILKGRK